MSRIKDIFCSIFCFFHQKEISHLKWSVLTAGIACGIVISAAAIAFLVDPHYRYRLPFFYDTVYYEIYATAPQILKSEDYDTLMLGTSMVRNFFLDDINKAFECNAIKLAASGGTMQDLNKFFDIAKVEKKEKLKNVILSLDIYSLNKLKPHYAEFDYMYRNDHKEDYRYLFFPSDFFQYDLPGETENPSERETEI